MMKAGWSARRVARQLGCSDGVGTSGSERCHLHEDQAQDALDRPVVQNTATSMCVFVASMFRRRLETFSIDIAIEMKKYYLPLSYKNNFFSRL
ncbi:hypothetical protein TNCV_4851921 [Trichonephila clavipes]|nr:hypothetical protein TNCV_4851921 [Trichonephila clavipes]